MSNEDAHHPSPSKKSIEAFRDSILESFSEVRDPRILEPAIRHELGHILFITLCAVLCGANTLKEIAGYAKVRKEWLSTIVELPNGVPSHSTFWLVFAMLDPKELQDGFLKWTKHLVKMTEGEVLAIDGKALRATAVEGKACSFIHTVSLWACNQQITLGQIKVGDKSNEITAIPKLLEIIDVAGTTITIDAMGTQTAIASKIVDNKADYVLALKGNQSKTYDEVCNFLNRQRPSISKALITNLIT